MSPLFSLLEVSVGLLVVVVSAVVVYNRFFGNDWRPNCPPK